jgi:hypothetical protein
MGAKIGRFGEAGNEKARPQRQRAEAGSRRRRAGFQNPAEENCIGNLVPNRQKFGLPGFLRLGFDVAVCGE